MSVALNSIWQETRQLPRLAKMELLEKLARQLRIEEQSEKEQLNWDQLYGIGKGVWNMDAQAYVDQLREERV